MGAAVALLVVAACGSGGGDTTSEPQADATVSSQIKPAVPTTATSLPPLLASTIGGSQIDVSTLVGQDALLWFWAPW